jgi:hypothetical protein
MTSTTTTTLNFPASASSFRRRVNAVPGIRAFGSRPGLRRHKWTATELSDLSVAYIEQSCDAPLWKIAETLRDQFCENKHRECEDESITTATTGCGYSAVPSIPAIILKLTDCVYLETNGAMGYLYVRRPTQLHADVWQHLQASRRHRAMIQSMKARAADAADAKEDDDAGCITFLSTMMTLTSQKATTAATKAKMQRSSIGKVRGRVFIDDDDEFEPVLPLAKRRKIITIDDNDDNDDNASDDDGDAMMTPLPHVDEAESASPTVFHFGSLADALSEIGDDDHQHHHSDDEMYDCERERAIQSANMTTSALGHRLETLSFRMNELVAEIDAIRQTVSSGDATVAPAERRVPCAKCHKSIDCQREAWTAYWRNRHSDTDMGETTYECEKCRTPLSSAEQQQVDEETVVAVATTPIAATAYQQLQPSHYQQQHVEWDYDYESGEENDYANYHDFIRGGENNAPSEEI